MSIYIYLGTKPIRDIEEKAEQNYVSTSTIKEKNGHRINLGDTIYWGNARDKTISYKLLVISKDKETLYLYANRLNKDIEINELQQLGMLIENNDLKDVDTNESCIDLLENNEKDNNELSDRLTHDMIILNSKFLNKIEGGLQNKKISGYITTEIFRKYIKEILEKKHPDKLEVSPPNSYVDGCSLEFDLIILKKSAEKIDDLNIYNYKDVVAALEIKKSGIYSNGSLDTQVKAFKKFVEDNGKKTKYAYITFIESYEKYFDKAMVSFDAAFCFLPRRSNRDFEDFEDFIDKIIQ